MSISPLAAAESAEELRAWLRNHQAPPTVRGAVNAEIIRLTAIASGKEVSTQVATVDSALAEVERLTLVAAELGRQLVELVASRDSANRALATQSAVAEAATTRLRALSDAIDRARECSRARAAGAVVEIDNVPWRAVLAARESEQEQPPATPAEVPK